MKFKFVDKIDEEKKEARILINGKIGVAFSGADWANEIKYLNDYNSSLKKINVSINSEGGRVIDGYSIVTAIKRSKIPVDTFADGLVASMAMPILCCGKGVYASDYAVGMIHDPFDEEDQAPEDLVKLIKDSLVKIMSGQTGISEVEMSTMMAKETWMSPAQLKEKGFVHEVKYTGRNIKPPATSDKNQIFAFYNSLNKKENPTPNPKKPNMKNLAAIFNLAPEASEASIETAVNTLVASEKAKTTEIATLKAERDALKTQKDALQGIVDAAKLEKENAVNTEIETFLNEAIKVGKIKAEEKDAWLNVAKVDFVNAKKVIGAMGKSKVADKILDAKKAELKNAGDGRDSWTIRDWEKKDPKGLETMKNETPDLYQVLYTDHYSKIKTENDAKKK